MFQRILVVLNEAQSQHCVFNISLRYAKANQAQLCLVDLDEGQGLELSNARSLIATAIAVGIRAEMIVLINKTEQALIEAAKDWRADLMVMGSAMHPSLIPVLPCTVLIVQQTSNSTISMTMQLKPKVSDLTVRDRLERVLELTPIS